MEIKKAQWYSEGDNIRIGLPLTKIDQSKRIVSGFASLDNADSQDDVMTKDANQKAFSRFRGNIREMHQPVAVGRMVDFREDSYYDPDTEKFYDGIWVDVYVSKGAPNTWEKVVDGTLQGFSIGGHVLDAEPSFNKDSGRSVRIVKDYELVELSLVDSPANKLANVFSITKSASGTDVVTGMIADQNTENVFWCETDKAAKTSSEEKAECPSGHKMQIVGWIEYNNADEKTEKVASVVNNYLSKQEVPAQNEGGVSEVANEDKVVKVDEVVAPEVDEVVENEDDKKADDEKVVDGAAADVSEVGAVEGDLSEKLDHIKALVEDGLEKNKTEVSKVVEDFDVKFEEFKKSIEDKFSELSGRHSELSEKFAGLKKSIDAVEKSVGDLDEDTAIKKSSDLGGSTEDPDLKKSEGIWGGSLFSK